MSDRGSIVDSMIASARLYQEYEDAVCRLAREEDKLAAAKCDFERDRAKYISETDPKLLGANEEQRKAFITHNFGAMVNRIESHSQSVEFLKCEAEVARIRVRASETTLRYLELLNNLKEG